MRKYFFSFLFLFFSTCSSDSKSDKSNYPFSIRTPNKSFYQKIETSTDSSANAGVDTSTNVGADTDTDTDTGTGVKNLKNKLEEFQFATVQQVEINTDADSSSIADSRSRTGASSIADTGLEEFQFPIVQQVEINTAADSSSIAGSRSRTGSSSIADTGLEEFQFATVQQVEINTDAGSSSIADIGLKEFQFPTVQQVEINTDAGSSLIAGSRSRTGASSIATDADINIVQKTADRIIQELTDVNVGGNLIQKEGCEGFSKADWINQDLSIKQSIQHFTRKKMQNLLSINREFPSPQDKEDSVKCFVSTAFSLNNILEIVTDHWWQSAQVSLQAPYKKILIEFMKHYFSAWVGYGILLSIKSISSDHISFVVEEPHLLENGQYAVVTNFNIMNFYSAKILWTVDVRSFPKELAFLDISFKGVSSLYLLRKQMYYLFRKKNEKMDEIIFELQNKMDDSSFADL